MTVGSCPPPFPPKKVLTAQFWQEMLVTAGWAILPDVGMPPKDLEARSGPNLGLLWQLFPVRLEEMENKHCKMAFENYTNFANRGKTENGAQYPQILLERCPDAPRGQNNASPNCLPLESTLKCVELFKIKEMVCCSQWRPRGFPDGSAIKKSACQSRGHGFDAWLGKSPGKESSNPSGILVCEIPWTKEPGQLQSIGL